MNYNFFFTDRYYEAVARLEARVERRVRKSFDLSDTRTILSVLGDAIAAREMTVGLRSKTQAVRELEFDEGYQGLLRLKAAIEGGQDVFRVVEFLLGTRSVAISFLPTPVVVTLLPFALLTRDSHTSELGIGVWALSLDFSPICARVGQELTGAQLSAVRSYVRLSHLSGRDDGGWEKLWNRMLFMS